jgi:hypothetical protein
MSRQLQFDEPQGLVEVLVRRRAMTLSSTDADSNFVGRLEEELYRLRQLRQRVLESLDTRLQGPRQRHYLRVQLLELNRSITSIRRVLSLPVLASAPRFRRERQAGTSLRRIP